MKHLGDITKINGAEVPLVDVITGGSPCQDLSVAGNRAGLSGERSGLFMEQIRIIKEMRKESERLLSIQKPNYDRRDIKPRYMVWENVQGAFSSNGGEDFRVVLEETAKVAEGSAVIPKSPEGKWSKSGCIMGNGWSIAWRLHDAQFWGVPQRRKRISLVADFGGDTAPKILFERKSVSGHPEKSGEKRQDATATIGNDTKKTGKLERIKTVCLNPWDIQSKHIQPEEGKAEALYSGECRYGGGESYVFCIQNLHTVRRLTPMECERLQGYPDGWTDIGEWIDSKGKKHKDSDSPRYKALGNSIALPFWDWMAERMCNKLREDGNNDLKMASLFDGIGGFPFVYRKHGCKPVWASEIEEFPIAVTKIRFKEESVD